MDGFNFECPVCGDHFKTEAGRDLHRGAEHSTPTKREQKSDPEPKEPAR